MCGLLEIKNWLRFKYITAEVHVKLPLFYSIYAQSSIAWLSCICMFYLYLPIQGYQAILILALSDKVYTHNLYYEHIHVAPILTAIQIAYHLFPACPALGLLYEWQAWKVSLIRSSSLNKHALLVCIVHVLLFIIIFRTAAIFHTFDNKNNPCMCLILNSDNDNEISSAKNVNDNYFLIHWEMVTLTYSPQSCVWVGRVVMITMNFTWKKKNFLVAVLLLLYYMLVILKHRHKIIITVKFSQPEGNMYGPPQYRKTRWYSTKYLKPQIYSKKLTNINFDSKQEFCYFLTRIGPCNQVMQ